MGDGTYELNLKHCTSLTALRLRLYTREMCVPENRALSIFVTLLDQIASNNLEEIILTIYADAMENLTSLDTECGVRELYSVRFSDLDALDWGGIQEVLVKKQIPSLTRIAVEGVGDPSGIKRYLGRYPVLAELVVFREPQLDYTMFE